MKDFIYENSCKVYFGKNQLRNLGSEALRFGKKVLLCYGGGSIKRSGLYDKVIKILKDNNIEIYELSGIEPNPRHKTANIGVELCKKNNIDLIIAVGGGSTIDCAKAIAATAVTESSDSWEVLLKGEWIVNALPIIAVLTNAATGSEMDQWSVISNMDTNEKLSLGGSGLLPKVAFENPEDSFTLSSYQTVCGAFDIFNHVLDNYYLAKEDTFDMILEFQEAVMRTVVKWTPVAIKEPTNYEARANLMWASSMALNTILDAGTVHGCACHMIEHELSAYYDITHGHGLAIVTPRWLTYILDESIAPAIYRLGVKVFNVETGMKAMDGAKASIKALENFCFNILGLKSTLTELGINEKHLMDMASHACMFGSITGPRTLNKEDVYEILKMCL